MRVKYCAAPSPDGIFLVVFLPGEAGEVPRRGGGVMGRTDAVAHDPSGTDYRATSPR